LFVAMIVDRYEADTAFSFAHSLRRNVCQEIWRPVAYSFPPPSKLRAFSMASVHRRMAVSHIDTELIASFLRVPGFSVPFRDIKGDSERIVRRLESLLYAAPDMPRPVALDVVEAGFYRVRAAFVVGRWVLADDSIVPFVVSLKNSPSGIFADAVLHRVADIHGLFSSALANFHVTTRLYYQTCVFLYSLMPRRPLGHHYSTIGFNHVGKVAILNEIAEQMRSSGQKFERSPGATGTVALGFTFDACSYHLKVIRDHPTSSYKWGAYPGVAAVIDKYRLVHEINRAGSMLDNVMYFNLRLDRDMFDPALLEELRRESSETVYVEGDGVFLSSPARRRRARSSSIWASASATTLRRTSSTKISTRETTALGATAPCFCSTTTRSRSSPTSRSARTWTASRAKRRCPNGSSRTGWCSCPRSCSTACSS